MVIGDYNYLFDPTVHLRRFFDAAGDYIFLIDEAHNLPDRARAMYSARFCKSSLTDARRAIGKGKSALKTALTKADKGFLEARRAVTKLAPAGVHRPPNRRQSDLTQQTSLLDTEPAEAVFPLPEPLLARDGTVFLQELPKELLRLLFSLQAPCRTGWRPTRRPMPIPSCSSSTLRCRISPGRQNGTMRILSPS